MISIFFFFLEFRREYVKRVSDKFGTHGSNTAAPPYNAAVSELSSFSHLFFTSRANKLISRVGNEVSSRIFRENPRSWERDRGAVRAATGNISGRVWQPGTAQPRAILEHKKNIEYFALFFLGGGGYISIKLQGQVWTKSSLITESFKYTCIYSWKWIS